MADSHQIVRIVDSGAGRVDVHFADGSVFEAEQLDVFVSYDTRYEVQCGNFPAKRLAEGLEALGYKVFWDQSMQTGDWQEQILINCKVARCVVTLETQRYFSDSEWCVREFKVGLEDGKLARFYLEPSEPPMDLIEPVKRVQRFFLDPIRTDISIEVRKRLNISPSLQPFAEAKPRIRRKSPIVSGTSASPETAEPKGTSLPRKPSGTLEPSLLQVDTSSMPASAAALIGRKAELAVLREAWGAKSANVVTLIGEGGSGKSAIAASFVSQLVERGGDGASRIFTHSFYSQGSSDNRRIDADGFFEKATAFFGGDGSISRDPIERARRLARHIGSERALLVLDGVEPLQVADGVSGGRLRDRSLLAFLQVLSQKNDGLVIVTSRLRLTDLSSALGVRELLLERLSPEDGVELLLNSGAIGRREDLEAAVEQAGGHALALKVLGSYAASTAGGDIRAGVGSIGELLGHQSEADKHDLSEHSAFRAIRSVVTRFEQNGDLFELLILNILGLFDRPAEPNAVRVLLKGPFIEDLSDAVFLRLFGQVGEVDDPFARREFVADWRNAVERLRKLGLLAAEDPDQPELLDAHPLVREYMGKRLDAEHPEAFRAAHERLYRYYSEIAPQQPGSLEATTPLFEAITHGVASGRVAEAFDQIYLRRILQGTDAAILRRDGAYGANLAVLSQFFAVPWTTPRPELSPRHQALLLNSASFSLRALGRLQEAVEPARSGIIELAKQQDWRAAAYESENLCELLLGLGRIEAAIERSAEALEYADRSGDAFLAVLTRTTRGDALHQAGRLDEAAPHFAVAQAEQAKLQPEYPYLYSLRGYQFGDLLITQGRADEALDHANWEAGLLKQQGQAALLDLALNALLVGRSCAMLAEQKRKGLFARLFGAQGGARGEGHDERASKELDEAVRLLRMSGVEHQVPRGLIARAGFLRWRLEIERGADGVRAQDDLAEAFDIAKRGHMRLFLADIALERARLALATHATTEARAHAEIAQGIIRECNYGRRLAELGTLEARL